MQRLKASIMCEHIELVKQLEINYKNHINGLLHQKAIILCQLQKMFYDKLIQLDAKTIILNNIASKTSYKSYHSNTRIGANIESDADSQESELSNQADIVNETDETYDDSKSNQTVSDTDTAIAMNKHMDGSSQSTMALDTNPGTSTPTQTTSVPVPANNSNNDSHSSLSMLNSQFINQIATCTVESNQSQSRPVCQSDAADVSPLPVPRSLLNTANVIESKHASNVTINQNKNDENSNQNDKNKNKKDNNVKVDAYECLKCEYKTKYTLNIRRHIHQHELQEEKKENKKRNTLKSKKHFKERKMRNVGRRTKKVDIKAKLRKLYETNQFNNEHESVQHHKYKHKHHKQTLVNLKPYVCPFGDCKKRFKLKAGLKGHIKNIHTTEDEKEFQCEECGKKFGQKGVLVIHQKNIHLSEKKWKCHICKKRFRLKSEWKRHCKAHI